MENLAEIIRDVTNRIIEIVRTGDYSEDNIIDAMMESGSLRSFLIDEAEKKRWKEIDNE